MIKLLNQHERQILKTVFEKGFDSVLPDEHQANIAAWVEGGSVKGFLMSEVLIRVGLLWTHPQVRNTAKGARIVKSLAAYTRDSIPQGASVIAIASDERYKPLFAKMGMREEEGTIYRIDL